MKIMSYRVTFRHDVNCNYFESFRKTGIKFSEVHTLNWPVLKEIYDLAETLKVRDIWHFYEPYVEVSWMTDPKKNSAFQKGIKKILEKEKIQDAKFAGGDPVNAPLHESRGF